MLTLTKDEIENSVYRNSDLKDTAINLYAKLEKAEAELAEFKTDIAATAAACPTWPSITSTIGRDYENPRQKKQSNG